MQKDSQFLGTEKIGKLLFRLALPAVTAQLVNMLYNIVDRVYIGRIPEVGVSALAGVGVCLPLIMLVSAFAALVSMGGAPRASIAMGAGDREKAERIMGNCMMLLVILAAILTLAVSLWLRPMLLFFGANAETIPYALQYMRIYALGTLFVQLALGMNAFITAQGFATTSMLTVLIGAVLNIALDPLFIFTFKMGVSGAALATILSQAVSAIWVIWFLRGKRTGLRLKRKNFHLRGETIFPALALGVSPFIMQATESAITICFNRSLESYGGTLAVGAMTILSSVMQFAMLPLMGFTQGAQPILSYNFGARNVSRVKEAFLKLLRVCVCYSAGLWLLVMLLPRAFAGLFTPDAALIDFTARALRIYLAAELLFGVQIACQQTFIAIGNAKSSLFLALLRKVILLIPLIFLLPMFLEDKTTAVYLAEPVADVLAVTVTAILFARQFGRALRQMGTETKP